MDLRIHHFYEYSNICAAAVGAQQGGGDSTSGGDACGCDWIATEDTNERWISGSIPSIITETNQGAVLLLNSST